MNSTATGDQVNIWYTVCPVPAASSIAIARGRFRKEFESSAFSLHSLRGHPDRRIREAHYDQSQANAFREGGNIPPIWAKSSGRPIKLIGLTWIESYAAIVAMPESGIRTAADLAGKRLGLVRRPHDPIDYPRATALRGYLAALNAAGMTRDDVIFRDIVLDEPLVARAPEPGVLSQSLFSVRHLRRRQGPEIRALLGGEIDALYLGTQGVELGDLAGAHLVTDFATLPRVAHINNLAPIAFTVREELLAEHPGAVDRYLAEAIRTARWARSHEAEAKRHIARDSSIAEELVNTVYTPDVHERLEPGLEPAHVEALEQQKAFLLAEGFIEYDFSVHEWIDRGPLDRARELLDDARREDMR